MVVDLGEGVEEVLEFGEVGGWGSWGEPLFEGLLESFDFAAGGGMVGSGVFLFDLEAH